MGAAGPHVASLLDKANKLSSDRVLASSNSILLPERALVWTLEQLVKKMTDNQHQDASLGSLFKTYLKSEIISIWLQFLNSLI